MNDNTEWREIAASYDAGAAGEWERLGRDAYHRLEFDTVCRYISSHFPAAGRVLDVGGGPGRYALELAKRGFDVSLVDLSQGCLDLASEKLNEEPLHVRERVRELRVGDVRDLSWCAADSFDAVLCLDPLSYLAKREERQQAVQELARVGKAGATVFLGCPGYLAVLRLVFEHQPEALTRPEFDTLLKDGNDTSRGLWRHFFRAAEIRELAESCGLTTLTMAGCEGLFTGLQTAANRWAKDEVAWSRWCSILARTAADPTVVDGSAHILYVGRVSP